MKTEQKRVGIIGVVINNLDSAPKVNDVVHAYNHLIVGRMGIPYRERNVSVIAFIVDGTSNEINALTGQIGRIANVEVKSMFAKSV